MYKVMIVDDEAIILSGIKFLLDWQKHDCVISQTARNGQEALSAIRTSPPDIVLCDINMPVMDGISLLKTVSEEFPYIVFIMLTNLEEFELARTALVYRAKDYLLKSRLEPAVLEKALTAAKAERDLRARMMVVNSQDYYLKKEQEELINRALQELIFLNADAENERASEILLSCGMLDAYSYLYIPFDYTAVPDAGAMTAKERRELLKWMQELTEKTADALFHKHYVVVDTNQPDVLVLFLYHLEEGFEDTVKLFEKKLSRTVRSIAQADCRVLYTRKRSGKGALSDCRREYQRNLECYYLGEPEEAIREQEYEALSLTGIGAALATEIRRRNKKAAAELLEKAAVRVRGSYHQKSQAIWLLNELNRFSSQAFAETGIEEKAESEALRLSRASEIEQLKTRKQVLEWIERLETTVKHALSCEPGRGNPLAEQARKYVLSHIEGHVSLQEAAAHAGVSEGYLSTVFKKEYGQRFVDFVNQAKIDYACGLLRDKRLMVAEIAYKLGFENAYYFSKVFRKYKGMTPTEYQKAGWESMEDTAPSETEM